MFLKNDIRTTVASSLDENLIDSIVAGVLDRLGGKSAPISQASGGRQPSETATTRPTMTRGTDAPRSPVVLSDRVVTEATLEAALNGSKAVRFTPRTVLTPSARDYLRVNGIEWAFARPVAAAKTESANPWAVLVVRSTPAVDRVFSQLLPHARRELLGCPDDAAKLAIAEIARGGITQAIVLAEQVHRAACLANRHAQVKAVAVREAADVVAIRKQLRANVWCLDPTGRSDFELRKILKTITA